jgi:hypothetical protein
MSIHKKEDIVKLDKKHSNQRAFKARELSEKVFMDRIKESRSFISTSKISESIIEDQNSELELSKSGTITIYDQSSNNNEISSQEWIKMPHIHSIYSHNYNHLYSLELVSKQGDVSVQYRFPLDKPIVRLGTHSSCECVIECFGEAKKLGKIGTVHCLLYCPMGKYENEKNGNVILVDNSSVWGTYIVSDGVTVKVPKKMSAGVILTPGLLICLGVNKEGSSTLSATEANEACIVFRVRCLEREL